MSMTSKQRMMAALAREKPDRLPVTIHQWQQYHLDTYFGGIDALDAFKACGLDASIQYFEAMGQFWIPNAEQYIVQSPEWREEIKIVKDDPDEKRLDHLIITPGGQLTYKTGGNRTTTWITEYLIKRHEDVALIEKFMPVAVLDRKATMAQYDRVGDAGILRGFVWGDQAGCWQHACCLMAEEQLILECCDNPDWVQRRHQLVWNRFPDEHRRDRIQPSSCVPKRSGRRKFARRSADARQRSPLRDDLVGR